MPAGGEGQGCAAVPQFALGGCAPGGMAGWAKRSGRIKHSPKLNTARISSELFSSFTTRPLKRVHQLYLDHLGAVHLGCHHIAFYQEPNAAGLPGGNELVAKLKPPMKKKAKQPASPESEREKRVEAAIKEARRLSAKLEKLRNGRPRVELSQEELDWRWHHLMRHKRFLDEE